MELRGKWVWVTGASSGLGRELAQQLAIKEGANLIITARRAARLEELKAELEPKAGVQVRVLAGDMGDLKDVDRLIAEVKQVELTGVVLNAGVTHFGHHTDLAWEDFEAMLRLNILGTVKITTELVRHLTARAQPSRIMLVTSMSGLMPVPFQSAYSGTKAFLTAWGTALAHELQGSQVSVQVFAPGGVATEMTSGEKFSTLSNWLAPAHEVAAEAIGALRSGPVLHVPGLTNRLGLFMFRFLPRNLVLKQLASTYRKALTAPPKR
jgi:hypothetical protein